MGTQKYSQRRIASSCKMRIGWHLIQDAAIRLQSKVKNNCLMSRREKLLVANVVENRERIVEAADVEQSDGLEKQV